MAALAWLTSRFAGPVMLGIALVVFAAALIDGVRTRTTIRLLEADRTELQGQMKTANENAGICHANIAGLGSKLDQQGEDIKAFARASEDRDKRNTQAMARIEAQGKAVRATSEAILARPLPPPDMACLEAARLLRDGL